MLSPASSIAFLTGSIDLLTKSLVNCSNFDLVKETTRCLGPDAVAVI